MVPTSKILVVDGYNVIHRLPELKPAKGGLEEARLQLALRVSAWGSRHLDTECLIVFDGDERFAGARKQRLSGVRCVFTSRPHAGDEEIIRRVREYRAEKRTVTVVSDDNHVANDCRAHGAVVEPARFLDAPKAPAPRAASGSRGPGKGIDPRTAARINKEMAEIFGSKDGKGRP